MTGRLQVGLHGHSEVPGRSLTGPINAKFERAGSGPGINRFAALFLHIGCNPRTPRRVLVGLGLIYGGFEPPHFLPKMQ